MTEAGWTAGKDVKQAGWYWWKYKGMLSIVELRAWLNGNKLYAKGGVAIPINALELDGEWLGPIAPDTYQQGRVAGIGECKDLVAEFTEAWLLAGMVVKLLTPAVHEAVAGLSSDLKRELQKLAQAAQDEKGVGKGT